MAKKLEKNSITFIIIFSIFLVVILGCQQGKDFKSVNYGCLTKDGSKIALTDFHRDFVYQSQPSREFDNYRLILDAKNGNIIWKDFSSSDQLVCGEDSSIVSVSWEEAKWIEGEKKVVFSKKSSRNQTNFIGMTDKDTFIREDRTYYLEKMSGGKTSSEKKYKSFPTFLVDKVGENTTKEFVLTETDVPNLDRTHGFGYLFKENKIIFHDWKKSFSLDLLTGKITSFGDYKEILKEKAKIGKFVAEDKTYFQTTGPIEINDVTTGEPKLAYSFEKANLDGRVEHIIDCCNHGLFLLYWGNQGNSLNVAKIDYQSGQIIWKSKNLLNYDKK